MNIIRKISTLMLCALSAMPLMAQQTFNELELLTVNEQVTTVITATEPIRFVDISTDKIAGDQPLGNTIRLKPKEGADVNEDGDILAIVTIVTERYRAQYALIYTTRLQESSISFWQTWSCLLYSYLPQDYGRQFSLLVESVCQIQLPEVG